MILMPWAHKDELSMKRASFPETQIAFVLFQLEKKIGQLKRIVADLSLNKDMLQHVDEKAL